MSQTHHQDNIHSNAIIQLTNACFFRLSTNISKSDETRSGVTTFPSLNIKYTTVPDNINKPNAHQTQPRGIKKTERMNDKSTKK